MDRRLGRLAQPLTPAAGAGARGAPYTLLKTIDLLGDTGGDGDWTVFDADAGTVWLAGADAEPRLMYAPVWPSLPSGGSRVQPWAQHREAT